MSELEMVIDALESVGKLAPDTASTIKELIDRESHENHERGYMAGFADCKAQAENAIARLDVD